MFQSVAQLEEVYVGLQITDTSKLIIPKILRVKQYAGLELLQRIMSVANNRAVEMRKYVLRSALVQCESMFIRCFQQRDVRGKI